MLLIVLTLPFHAFMGVTIMAQKRLIGGSWYPELHEGPMGAWLPDPHVDQHLAGGILWSAGDAVGLLFVGGAVRAVGALVDARGGARGPPPRPARGARGTRRAARLPRATRRTARAARGRHAARGRLPVAFCP